MKRMTIPLLWALGALATLLALATPYLVASLAHAQDAAAEATPTPLPADSEAAPLKLIPQVIQAVSEGNWGLVASAVLMTLAWFAARNVEKIKRWFNADAKRKKWMGWYTAGIAATAYAGPALQMGKELGPTLLQGITLGVGAVGLYELIWKPFFGKSLQPEGEG